MNSHKCDLCGLYLTSGCTACEECIKATKKLHQIADNGNDIENEEDAENEYYL